QVSDILYKDSAGNTLATQHYTYDGDLRPASSATTWQSNGSSIYSDGISFDAVGNVISRVTSQASISGQSGSGGNETQNFCYDELDHLTQWSDTASSKHEWYFYNATGERILKRSNDGSTIKDTVYAFGLEEHQYLEDGSGSGSNLGNSYYYSLAGKKNEGGKL